MRFNLLIVFFIILSQKIDAQHFESRKLNLDFTLWQAENPASTTVLLAVTGDLLQIQELTRAHNGKYKYSTGAYHYINLPQSEVEQFASYNAVESIYFSLDQPNALADMSRAHVLADSVHQGAGGLVKKYRGKGVIVGIIDSGIDLNHEDFKDDNGFTRILRLWDHNDNANPSRTPSYGYGAVYSKADIDSGNCPHTDPANQFGHGTNVAGIAAGNGLSVPFDSANYTGIAPDANLIVISTNFGLGNWLLSVADAVDYIYKVADSLGVPAVVNASLGTYLGSHDGFDPAAQAIASFSNQKPGRAFIGALGNAGDRDPWHLKTQVQSDTSLTYFQFNPAFSNPSAFAPLPGAVFFELYADTNQLKQLEFQLVADDTTTATVQTKAHTQAFQIDSLLGGVYFDTLRDASGNRLGTYQFYSFLQDSGVVRIQVYLPRPDSSHFLYGIKSFGQGSFDSWSSSWLNRSDILSANQAFGNKIHPLAAVYKNPDTLSTLVSSWACHPNLLSIGNFTNRNSYLDVDGITQTVSSNQGNIAPSSSAGPTRTGVLKPELTAPGDMTLASGLLTQAAALMNSSPANRSRVGIGGKHYRNGGTSMSAPVVAGGLALLYEKCPEMTFEKARDLARLHATKDAFVNNGNVFEWGSGKLNIFSLLESLEKPISIAFSDTSICAGDSLEFSVSAAFDSVLWSDASTQFTRSISDSGVYAFQVLDTLGCWQYSDTFSIHLNPKPNVSLPKDTSFCSNNPLTVELQGTVIWSDSVVASQRSFSQVQNLEATISNSFGCSVTDSLRIDEVFAAPQANLGADTLICQGDELLLSVPFTSTINWNDGSSDTAKRINSPGMYTVYLLDSNGCESRDTTFINLLLPPAVNLGPDTAVCSNDFLELFGPQAANYQWSTGDSTRSIFVNNPDTLWLRATAANGCSATDSVFIDTLSPTPFSLVDSVFICQQASATLTAPIQAAAYNWNNQSSDSSFVITTPGSYFLETTNAEGCNWRDSVQVTSARLADFNLQESYFLCNNATLELFAGTSASTYLWSDSSAQSSLFVSESGQYWATLSDSSGCVYSDTTWVVDVPVPNLSIGNDTIVCRNQAVRIQANLPFESYEWSTGESSNSILATAEGIYTISVTDERGCVYTDFMTVFHYLSPPFSTKNDTAICTNEDFSIIHTPGNFESYNWNTGSSLPTDTITTYGFFWFSATDRLGCTFRDTFQVSPIGITNFDIGADTNLFLGDSIQLSNSLFGESLSWSTGDQAYAIWVTKSANAVDTIWAFYTNNEGCLTSDTILLFLNTTSVMEQGKNLSFSVFPNPTNGEFTVRSKSGIANIKVFNSLGQEVWNEASFGRERFIHTTSLSKGMYILELRTIANEVFRTQLLIE